MIRLGKNEEPALDCEAEVMVDLMELANTYVEWYRSADLYTVRAVDMRGSEPDGDAVRVITTHAPKAINALKGAFANWNRERNEAI